MHLLKFVILGLLCYCALWIIAENRLLSFRSFLSMKLKGTGNEKLARHVKGDNCTPSCHCTNQTFYSMPTNFKLNDIFEIDSMTEPFIDDNQEVVCIWNGTGIHRHLPHWLQIMYRCWSWWALFNDTRHQAILEIPIESQGYWNESLLRSPLAQGLWDDMKDALNIEIMMQDEKENRTDRLRAKPVITGTPWFANVDTVNMLRKHVIGKHFPGRPLSGCRDSNTRKNVVSTRARHITLPMLALVFWIEGKHETC